MDYEKSFIPLVHYANETAEFRAIGELSTSATLLPPTHMRGEVVRENGNADSRVGFEIEDDSPAILLDRHPNQLARADLIHPLQPEEIAVDRNIVDLVVFVSTDRCNRFTRRIWAGHASP